MSDRHEWTDRSGFPWAVEVTPEIDQWGHPRIVFPEVASYGHLPRSHSEMGAEILRLSAALAKASEERLALAIAVDLASFRDQDLECEDCERVYRTGHADGCKVPAWRALAARVVEESGNG